MHCVAVACLVSFLWFAGGYSLAFVGSNPWIGDLSQAFFAGLERGAVHPATTIPDTVYIMFQMTFAIITPGRKPSLVGSVTGTIAGLATVTPASGFIGPFGAVIIGIVSGCICYSAVQIVKLRYFVDDSLDVFAVHGIGGMTGTLLTAILMPAVLGGVGFAENVTLQSQLGVQATGVIAAAVWSAGMSYALIKITELLVGVRVVPDFETQGLDLSTHGESGYNVAFGGSTQ